MEAPKHSPGTIISPKGQIAATLFLPVLPEFTMNDETPGPKGCWTLIITPTSRSAKEKPDATKGQTGLTFVPVSGGTVLQTLRDPNCPASG